MKKYGIVLLVIAIPVVIACLILIPGQIRSKHAATLFVTLSSLKVAAVDQELDGTFTNHYPQYCHISCFTNHYTVSGTDYQCALAADAWDYRDRSNLLAITTNSMLLFIDKSGVIRLDHWQDLPGY